MASTEGHVLATLVIVFGFATAAPEVKTNVGVIIGIDGEATFANVSKPVTQFLGIPYAEEPTGLLRFTKPVPKAAFITPFNASSLGPVCPQNTFGTPDKNISMHIKEDCLSLNIYVPGDMTSLKYRAGSFPVMIWIYGGGFVNGASEYYDGSVISAFNDVIVVTLNYRLSVFGFLSTGDDASPGNYGLWDQQLAIKWVHDNIAPFGGDVTKVTIAGESAGSASVYYQATYPGNKGLFHRIIGESGVTMSPWAFTGNPQTIQHNLAYYAKNINCSLADTSTFVACLRNKTIVELMAALRVTERVIQLRGRFSPVIDGEFVSKQPNALFDGPDTAPEFEMFKSVDILTGTNSMDGSVYVLGVWKDVIEAVAHIPIDKGCPKNVFDNVIVPHVTQELYNRDSATVDEAIVFEYTDWSDPDNANKTRGKLMNMSTDFTFLVPTIKSINKHFEINKGSANSTSAYFYKFSHLPSFLALPDWLTGSIHSMEVPFVFGFPESLFPAGQFPVRSAPTAAEIQLASYIMVYWTNFVKSGDPNFPVKLSTIQWPPYFNSTQAYIDFTVNMSQASVKSKLIPQRYAFWEVYIPELLRS